MAVQIIDSGNRIERDTNVVAATSPYTCIFWYNLKTLLVNSYNIFTTSDTIDDQYAAIFGNAGNFQLEVNNGSSIVDETDSSIPTDTWIPLIYVRNGTSHSFYIGGILIGTVTLNIISVLFSRLFLGDDGTADGNTQQFYNFREWDTNLSVDDINAEINSPNAVVHTANLVTYTPLTSDLLDISGNANDWTAVGTVTFVANPTLPTNLTPATAIDLGSSLPVNLTGIVANPTGGFIFTLWFKYTTISIDYVLWAFAIADLTNYLTDCRPWLDVNDAPLTNGKNSSPFILPIEGTGLTYYFSVAPGNGSNAAIPETLTFKLKRWVNNNAPAGSVIIPNDGVLNDNYPFPLGFVNPNISNGIIAYINGLPVTECMAILPDGTICIGNEDAATNETIITILKGSDLSTLHTVDITPSHPQAIVKSGDGLSFYFIKTADLKLYALSTAGVIGGTTYNLVNAHNVAISPDNSTAYYQQNNNSTIKSWNLGTNSANADFFSGSAGKLTCRDLLCLADGSVVVMNQTDNNIKRYDSGGTLQWTITPTIHLDTSHGLDRMCIDPDGISFWAYLRGNGAPQPNGVLNLVHYRASDGFELSSEPGVVYPGSEGGYDQEDITLTPVEFGASSSCPIGISTVDFTTPNTGGTLILGKGSNPQIPNTKNFTIHITGQPDEILQTDTDVILTLPPGTYSVTEEPDPTYSPEYLVRNDPTNNNLAVVVTSGDTNEVVTINSLKTKYGGLYKLVPGKINDTLLKQDGSTEDLKIDWFFDTTILRDE